MNPETPAKAVVEQLSDSMSLYIYICIVGNQGNQPLKAKIGSRESRPIFFYHRRSQLKESAGVSTEHWPQGVHGWVAEGSRLGDVLCGRLPHVLPHAAPVFAGANDGAGDPMAYAWRRVRPRPL